MSDEDVWDDEDTQENKFLLFHLGDEIYGLPIAQVISIIEMQKITEVPDLPPYMRGVINLRGTVLPVLDLRLRFGLPARPYNDRTCIIIVRPGESSTGLICDTVAEVQVIAPQDIVEPVRMKKETSTPYLSGLGKTEGAVRLLLDVEKVLAG